MPRVSVVIPAHNGAPFLPAALDSVRAAAATVARTSERMRILVLNWRYVDHPAAGGAEVLTHGVLRWLVEQGHEATVFTASYPGSSDQGVIDGVRIVRRGRQWTVHAHAWRWLRRRRTEFDRVIDEINTIPFFTPLYLGEEQRRLWIHQLAREYWWRETRGFFRVIAPIGYVLEPFYLRVYRHTSTITISQSSRRDLERLGLRLRPITVIPLPIDAEPVATLADKPEGYRVIVLGRLTHAKFVEEAVQAFARIQRELPEATLDIVGSGNERYARRLERMIARDGLHGVTFHGRVSTDRRQELLAAAHVHIFASHREGWGLTVSEAGAAGTPSIGYDAPGVRDSIANNRLLAKIGDSGGLARLALELAKDPELYADARHRAWENARAMSIERTTEAFGRAIDLPAGRAVPSAR